MESIPQDLKDLFAGIETTLAKTHPKIRHGWYIAVASTLIAHNQTNALKHLYTYLVSSGTTKSNDHEDESATSSRDRPEETVEAYVSRRLREVCMKIWTIVGIPKVVTAFVALGQVEKQGRASGETEEARAEEVERRRSMLATTSTTTTPSALTSRGQAAMHALYLSNLPAILSAAGSHTSALTWLEEDIIYGLFLSDTGVLDAVENELVVLPGIVAQDVRPQDVANAAAPAAAQSTPSASTSKKGEETPAIVGANSGLQQPAMWHVRGLIRLGVPREDAVLVLDVVERVAREVGGVEKAVTDRWIRAQDVYVGE
ncbi:MAG: hypothetical protein M1819_003234 [Sarea resinae]|nr:MAG: hypothetical protein M1819_003234 [Sarea resinae]